MSHRQKILEHMGLFYERILGKFLHSKKFKNTFYYYTIYSFDTKFCFISPRIGFYPFFQLQMKEL